LACMSVFPGYLRAKDTLEDKITFAIDHSNVKMVKRLLRRIGSNLTQKDKNELLETAREIINEYKPLVSLGKSGRDLTKFIAGLFFSGGGAFIGVNSVKAFIEGERLNKKLAPYLGLYGAGMLLLGLHLTVKGWNCSTASEPLTTALRVEELINDTVAQDNDEFWLFKHSAH
ncbi:hypothetical protein H0W26_04265, partial [Candidatus Dependentiae bacterium]|nr:hypothetical protein [Candidatus Dependentiae bacterium]